MTLFEILSLISTTIGPFFASIITFCFISLRDKNKQKTERRLQIFRTLMTTRGPLTAYDKEQLTALNSIEVEWNGKTKTDRAVYNSWKKYHLLMATPEQTWFGRDREHFNELLLNMAKSLKVETDLGTISQTSYIPQAQMDDLQNRIKIQQTAKIILEKILQNEGSPLRVVLETPKRTIADGVYSVRAKRLGQVQTGALILLDGKLTGLDDVGGSFTGSYVVNNNTFSASVTVYDSSRAALYHTTLFGLMSGNTIEAKDDNINLEVTLNRIHDSRS